MFGKKMNDFSPAWNVVQKWKDRGVFTTLDSEGEVRVFNGQRGKDPMDVPEDAFSELSEYYREIKSDLYFWKRQREKTFNTADCEFPDRKMQLTELKALTELTDSSPDD